MAGDWIKVRLDLADDPAVIGIAGALGVDEDTVVGKLCRLWSWANSHTVDGNAPGVTGKWIDRYLRVDGFAAAMAAAGWLQITASGIQIPKWELHNSQSAKSRALAAKRVAGFKKRQRSGNAEGNAPSVTQSLPSALPREEKRREEKTVAAQQAAAAAGGPGQPAKPPPKNPKSADFDVPPELDTPECREAWKAWLNYLGEKGKRYPSTVAKHGEILAAMGADRARAAIDHSITRGWNTPIEPEARTPPPPAGGADTFEAKLARAKEAVR